MESSITAHENVADDVLTLDYVKSRFLNEEIRESDRENCGNQDASSANFLGGCFHC